ncbi:MAG TPA: ABC transporter permease [Butyricimonas virosa]|uniref:ABC transporter permease n=1 Tax=Butyricimonas virosa TaxID=544645 RepID=A0A921H810_9BACT|nr:ABC transporter permease [Butyricimonas virosa]
MNLEWYIAHRLLKGDGAKSVSVPIVRIAIVGIALGLCVMLLSLFIITGFKYEITEKLSGFTAHLSVVPFVPGSTSEGGVVRESESLVKGLKEVEGVKNVYGYIEKPAIFKSKEEIHGVVLKGIDVEYDVVFFRENLKEGKIPDFKTERASNEILISASVADMLEIGVGGKVTAHFVQDPPRARVFIVAGIYDTGFKEYDDVMVLVDERHLTKLNDWGPGEVSGIAIELEDVERLNEVVEDVENVVYDASGNYEVQTLADVAPQIFDWLALLNMNVWVILILIVTVAGFNMVSGLLILILDKTTLIGILKALGYKNVSLRKLFLYISAGLIIKGMLWGNVLAFVLAGIQAIFHVIHLDPVTYYMDTVPINFSLGYVILLNVGVIVITVLMLIVPTMLISKISPVKAIKFE